MTKPKNKSVTNQRFLFPYSKTFWKEKDFLLATFLFAIVIIVYFLTSPGKTPYNYFTRLADGFLHFRLYTTVKPPWLNELIPFNGHYFVALPPMPAIVMMPFVFLFGDNFSETTFSILFAGINTVLVYLLLRNLDFTKLTGFFVSLFFAFGSNFWYTASIGSSWYNAHIVAIFFLLLALLISLKKQYFFLVGLCIGMSFWARTSVLFTLPFFYMYFYKELWPFTSFPKRFFQKINIAFDRIRLKNSVLLLSGVLVFIFLDALYNYLRFGTFSPFGPYKLIQDYDTNTVVNGVYMSTSYIPRHIDALLFRLPKFQDQYPFMIPSLYATAIWFTSPLILFIFRLRKNLLYFASWSAVISTLFIVMMWAGVGFTQFGYRFALDFFPFLLILVALGVGKRPNFFAWVLLILSIVINFWAVFVLNKLGLFVM